MTKTITMTQDLERSYFQYAVEVITDRALPRVEDGLLPVQRRILYAMHAMGLRHNTAHKKSARVVGEVLGKFHPHGDVSIYGSMVRLAQDFSMGIPLVDGQGNFGSIDGDSPAAMRYTEARLSAVTQAMLQDINQDAIDWVDNFDGSLQEPVILPVVMPNLLVNGASGIAVGMSTNIPPHNLGEVSDALIYMARNWDNCSQITVDDLLKFIPGPDFPTGGVAYRFRSDGSSNGSGPEVVDTIRDAYLSGRGKIVTQARVDIEDLSGGKANIVITELPYAVQKSTVIDKIAAEVKKERIEGVSDLRDESDYTGMRMVVEVMRGYKPRQVLEQLLTYTQLRATFGVISRALILEEGESVPHLLSLHQILEHFIHHRLTVIIRRSQHELGVREARLFIIEGLLKAFDMIDAVVAAIRKSASRDAARTNLQQAPFHFSEVQAKAIVALPLGNLASLEVSALKSEQRELRSRIKYLKGLLDSEQKRLEVVLEETEGVKNEFAQPRRTVILDNEEQAAGLSITIEADLIKPQGPQVVALTTRGVIRANVKDFSYRIKDSISAKAVETHLLQLQLQPEDSIILVSNKGRSWKAQVGKVPPKATFADIGLSKGEYIVGGGVLRPDTYLVMGTKTGNIKRVEVQDLLTLSEAFWTTIIGQDEKDELLFAAVASDEASVMFFTQGGKASHFQARLVNPQATPSARGVAGIKLAKTDSLIAGAVIEPDEQTQVVIVSEMGYIKQVDLALFPLKGRNTQGVQSLDITKTTGKVVAAAVARPQAQFCDILSVKGLRQRLELDKIPQSDRRKRGERFVKLADVIKAVLL